MTKIPALLICDITTGLISSEPLRGSKAPRGKTLTCYHIAILTISLWRLILSEKIIGVLGVMIAKRESTRLPGKNLLDFNGHPMFIWNLKKLLNVFETVVFDSDCHEMRDMACALGAIPHKRKVALEGNDVPSVPIFQSIIEDAPEFQAIINLQANSPGTPVDVIKQCAQIIEIDSIHEVLTFYSSRDVNGSVWGFSRERLNNYGDYYVHYPDALVLDNSIDIHTREEFLAASNEK